MPTYPLHLDALRAAGHSMAPLDSAIAATAALAVLNRDSILRPAVKAAGATVWPTVATKAQLVHFLVTGQPPANPGLATSLPDDAPRVDVRTPLPADPAPPPAPDPYDAPPPPIPPRINPPAPPEAAPDSLAVAIASAIGGLVKAGLDAGDVARAVDDAIAARLPALTADLRAAVVQPVHIHVGGSDAPVVRKLDGPQHARFAECLGVVASGVPLLMAGPAGSGKTTIAEQTARALDLPFGFLSCCPGLSESWLLGRATAQGGYVPAQFVTLYENGGVFLLDEVDNADDQTLNMLNAAIANGSMALPMRGDAPLAKRSQQFYLVAGANTWGTGTDAVYQRNQLGGAFLDRFVMGKVFVDYDERLEDAIAAAYGVESLLPEFRSIRERVTSTRVRRIVGTRALLHAGRLHASNPDLFPLSNMMQRLFEGWSAEERAKALGR